MCPEFQSTPPVKAATRKPAKHIHPDGISIHAAREGGDTFAEIAEGMQKDFNPRRP